MGCLIADHSRRTTPSCSGALCAGLVIAKSEKVSEKLDRKPTLDQSIPAGVSLSRLHNKVFMAHTTEEKKKLLNRVRRIRGQVEAIERTLDQEAECSEVLHNISACRGAMDALMAEVIEGHIRFHVLDPKTTPTDEQAQAADDLIQALRAYLK
jgi:DNA-binding FrmR family transcriptional regulator